MRSQGNGEGQLQEVSRPPRLQHQRRALLHHLLLDGHLQETGKDEERHLVSGPEVVPNYVTQHLLLRITKEMCSTYFTGTVVAMYISSPANRE